MNGKNKILWCLSSVIFCRYQSFILCVAEWIHKGLDTLRQQWLGNNSEAVTKKILTYLNYNSDKISETLGLVDELLWSSSKRNIYQKDWNDSATRQIIKWNHIQGNLAKSYASLPFWLRSLLEINRIPPRFLWPSNM